MHTYKRTCGQGTVTININSDWSGMASIDYQAYSGGQSTGAREVDARSLLRGDFRVDLPSLACQVAVSLAVETYLTGTFIRLAEGIGLPR